MFSVTDHQRKAKRSGGPTLAGLLSARPAKPDVVLPRFIAVIEAIEDAHANNRWHRCLDPQTISFNNGRADLPSYEAKALEETVVSASPKYSAPDYFQDRSTAENCGARDIYTLGFIFYEIFLGKEICKEQSALSPYLQPSCIKTLASTGMVMTESPNQRRKLRPPLGVGRPRGAKQFIGVSVSRPEQKRNRPPRVGEGRLTWNACDSIQVCVGNT